jgi:hypothetical protein
MREKKKLFGLDQKEKTLTLNVKPILSRSEERAQLMERLQLLKTRRRPPTWLWP